MSSHVIPSNQTIVANGRAVEENSHLEATLVDKTLRILESTQLQEDAPSTELIDKNPPQTTGNSITSSVQSENALTPTSSSSPKSMSEGAILMHKYVIPQRHHFPSPLGLPKSVRGGTGLLTNVLGDPDAMFKKLLPPHIVYHQASPEMGTLPFTIAIQAEQNSDDWSSFHTNLWPIDEAPRTTPFTEVVNDIRKVVSVRTGGYQFNYCVLQLFSSDIDQVVDDSDITLSIESESPIVIVYLSPGHKQQIGFNPMGQIHDNNPCMTTLDHNSMLQINLNPNSRWNYTMWGMGTNSTCITLTFRVIGTIVEGRKWSTNQQSSEIPRMLLNYAQNEKLGGQLIDFFLMDAYQPGIDGRAREGEVSRHEVVHHALHKHDDSSRTKHVLHLLMDDDNKVIKDHVEELRVKIVLAHLDIPWTAGRAASVLIFSDREKNRAFAGEVDIITYLRANYGRDDNPLPSISYDDRMKADMLLRSWNEDVTRDVDILDLSMRRFAHSTLITYWQKEATKVTNDTNNRRTSYFAGNKVGLLDYYLWAIFYICLVRLPESDVSQNLQWGRWSLSELGPDDDLLHWYRRMTGLVTVNTALQYKGGISSEWLK